MGRISSIEKAKLVHYDEKTDTSKCYSCGKVLKGYLLGNIKRHYITLHNYTFGVENTKKEVTNQKVQESIKVSKLQSTSIQNVNDHLIISKNITRPTSKVSNQNSNDALMSPSLSEDISFNVTENISLREEVRKRNADFEAKLRNSNINDVPKVPEACQRDHSDIFGEYIAAKHRKYSEHVKSVVEHSICEILFKADMGKHDRAYRRRDLQITSSVDENYNTSYAEAGQDQSSMNILNNIKISRASSVYSVSRSVSINEI